MPDEKKYDFMFKGYDIVGQDGTKFCTHHGITWWGCGRKSVTMVESALHGAQGELVEIAKEESGLNAAMAAAKGR